MQIYFDDNGKLRTLDFDAILNASGRHTAMVPRFPIEDAGTGIDHMQFEPVDFIARAVVSDHPVARARWQESMPGLVEQRDTMTDSRGETTTISYKRFDSPITRTRDMLALIKRIHYDALFCTIDLFGETYESCLIYSLVVSEEVPFPDAYQIEMSIAQQRVVALSRVTPVTQPKTGQAKGRVRRGEKPPKPATTEEYNQEQKSSVLYGLTR